MGYEGYKEKKKVKAHAIGILDTTVSPPLVKGVMIASAPAHGLTKAFHLKTDYFDLARAEGETFEAAEKNLHSFLENYHPWALTLLK